LSTIRLTHAPSGTILAEGPKGFGGITSFEGDFYVRRKYLRTDALKVNWVPGLCSYKFLYVWLDLRIEGWAPSKFLGWLYWLPNPLRLPTNGSAVSSFCVTGLRGRPCGR